MLRNQATTPFDQFRDLDAPALVQIILKQRDHYGDALIKLARLARKMADDPRPADLQNLADIALQLRETYGLGEARLDVALRGPGPARRPRPVPTRFV